MPTRAAGFIKEGQAVRLLYDAFPYQKFGFFNGQVETVSKSVIPASDLTIAPLLQEPIFVVSVRLDSQYVQAEQDKFPLQSGMSLSADLILEKRAIWEWMLAPFLKRVR